MDFLFILICVFLIFIVAKRKLDNQVAELKFKYALYALRDRIRLAAINKEIDPEETWLFQYYDQSFSKQIKKSARLNIVTVIYYWTRHSDEEELLSFQKDFIAESEKYKLFKEVRYDFHYAMFTYVYEQNKLLIKYVLRPLLGLFISLKTLELRAWKIMGSLLVIPETSVSSLFMQHKKV